MQSPRIFFSWGLAIVSGFATAFLFFFPFVFFVDLMFPNNGLHEVRLSIVSDLVLAVRRTRADDFAFMHIAYRLFSMFMHNAHQEVTQRLSFCLFLSVSVCFCLFLSVYVCFCLFLSVSVCFCLFLLCSFPFSICLHALSLRSSASLRYMY
ncbi:hypothetical protein K504DRAFT_281235 [Pleomassaria siparia CBS 279.74]|uniref:Uncharacterized protein n=1 Tax=Pleomassaria siparia CBS 279.74 TaxID=1314801 RepID=A0A6G1KAR7_9PLEO|nr:hypothetical protein K504DRAFT_281235 [Pleomassaria siparia CBS 279.74]